MKGPIRHMQGLNLGTKTLLSQVFQLAQYCLVMPASNAVSEQKFSVLRRIKSYLRNTMTQVRRNHTMCFNIHTTIPQIEEKRFLRSFSISKKIDFQKLVFSML